MGMMYVHTTESDFAQLQGLAEIDVLLCKTRDFVEQFADSGELSVSSHASEQVFFAFFISRGEM